MQRETARDSAVILDTGKVAIGSIVCETSPPQASVIVSEEPLEHFSGALPTAAST